MPLHSLLLPLRIIPDAVHAEMLRADIQPPAARPAAGGTPAGTQRKIRVHPYPGRGERDSFPDRAGTPAVRPRAGRADVRISGKVEDFWQLATRREDPDTLFFSRRLCIEGDTETGVHVKNLLDALDYDWEAHLHDVFGPVFGAAVFPCLTGRIAYNAPSRP